MNSIDKLATESCVTVRRANQPDPDGWMQHAWDNPALDITVEAGNLLGIVPFYPNANLRSYAFLAQGIPYAARGLARRRVEFALRVWPEQLMSFCQEVRPAIVIGDENPLRVPERWRENARRQLRVPFWTVEADTILTKARHGNSIATSTSPKSTPWHSARARSSAALRQRRAPSCHSQRSACNSERASAR